MKALWRGLGRVTTVLTLGCAAWGCGAPTRAHGPPAQTVAYGAAYDAAAPAPQPGEDATPSSADTCAIDPSACAPGETEATVNQMLSSGSKRADTLKRSPAAPTPRPSPSLAKGPSPPPAGADDAPAAGEATGDSTKPSTPTTASDEVRRPLLIYEAHLGLAVFHADQNLDQIENLAKESGGYLVSRSKNDIVVRVPAAQFQASLDAILKLGDVRDRRIQVRDVTAQFSDLEIRMKNALAMRERLEQLLSKAQNVEEALAVEEQLSRVTEEIERMKGQLKLLREMIAYSTIRVVFFEQQQLVKSRVQLPFPWLGELGLGSLLELF